MKKVLAIAFVVLMLTAMATPLALAADGVVITPNATVGGETVTMTANGVGDQITVFDLGSIGFGTGIEYCLWFDHSGSFSFDKDVTLVFQGQPKAECKAGTVYNISEGIYSETYLQLDDGNMLMIIDSENPGNFASLPADTPMAAIPATINGVPYDGAAAPAPAAPAGPATGTYTPGAPAAGIESGAPITVYVSISANGILEIASQPVEITTYSVEAAIVAAHEKYYPGGISGFGAGIDPTYGMYMINTLWGVATTPYVVLNTAPLGSGANSAYISADTCPVVAGDNIIIVADAAGMVPPCSMEYDPSNGVVKVNQWALDFTTFQYTSAALENVEVCDAATGEVLATTNALGIANVRKTPACGVVCYKGVGAIRMTDTVSEFDCVKDKYTAPAHDYSIFGGADGKSLLRIVIIGVGLIIPLFIVVLYAYNKELKTGGVKYEDLRGDSEVTRHL